jgi:NAD-dependent dihydropyrimidine dehydrogenase PreA subunit
MGLPTLATPKYELTIPSTGQKIEYRPFLVKEEKVLLLANETKDEREQIRAMKQVIENCTFSKVDIDSLASFDIEYLFLKLRSKSVGETIEVGIKCSSCAESCPTTVNINDVEVKFDPKFTNRIKLSETVGVLMRYPNYEDMINLSQIQKSENSEDVMAFIAGCIDKIYDDKQVYNTSDFTKEEVVKFMDELSQVGLKKIMAFFENMPVMQKDIKIKCPKCSKESEVTLRGAQSFFQ